MKAMQNDWYKKIEENLPDFFTGSSSEMWEKGRSKDSDFPPVCHAAVASGKKIQYNGHRDSMGFGTRKTPPLRQKTRK